MKTDEERPRGDGGPEEPAPGELGLRRVLLRIAYRGTAYCGWQRQPNGVAVQEVVEQALGALAQRPVKVMGASRTDAGVHALAQHAHVDVERRLPAKALVLGVNQSLPEDVRVIAAWEVAADLHAQRDARAKLYTYRLCRDRVIDPLRAERAVPLDARVSLDAMREALPIFVGRHDFSAFAKSGGSHDDPHRELFEVTLDQRSVPEGANEVHLRFRGDGFLRGMVRAMVGTLIEIGRGRLGTEDLRRLLDHGGARAEAGPNAPAHGLELSEIEYPPEAVLRGFDGRFAPPSGEPGEPGSL